MVKIENATFYSITEVADLFNCSTRTIRRYVDAGKINGRRLGRTWYFEEGTIKDYFSEREGVSNGK